MKWFKRKRDPNKDLPFCVGCPDHEGCMQGACYLSGGPCHPDVEGDK